MNYIEKERYVSFVPMYLSRGLFYTMLRLNWTIPYRLWKVLDWKNLMIAFMGNYFHKYERYVHAFYSQQTKAKGGE
jgi:hypothetical protein